MIPSTTLVALLLHPQENSKTHLILKKKKKKKSRVLKLSNRKISESKISALFS